jgi:hypothetical protein
MMTLMGGGALLKGGSQLYQGVRDKREGDRLEAQAGERPEYQIPESVDKMIGLYRQMAEQGLPGQGLMEQGIQAQTARTIGAAGQLADSPVAALSALGGAQDREMNALRDLQVRASQYRAQAQQGYASAVGSRSQYEDERWRQNQLMPWEIDMNRSMQLQTQGKGNIMGGIDSIGSGMVQAGSAFGTASMYNGMYPSMPTATTPPPSQAASPPPMFPYVYNVPTNPMTPADTASQQGLYGNALPYSPAPNYGWK